MIDAAGFDREFYVRLLEVARAGRFDPEWLLAMMATESGLSPRAFNRNTGARGMAQLMPFVLTGLGWKPGDGDYDSAQGEFRNLDAERQLVWAGRYFEDWRTRFGLYAWSSRAQMYVATFLPARLSNASDPDYVLVDRVTWKLGYSANAGLDADRDGRILVGELELAIRKAIRGRAAGRYSQACQSLAMLRAELAEATEATVRVPFGMVRPSDVRAVQTSLSALGFDPGPIDSVMGPRTVAAVRMFQVANRLRADGMVGPITYAAIALAMRSRSVVV